jgi:deazaflavin-dependent oxidoreductase (nitroreductase family)
MVVVDTNGGNHKLPGWSHNLKAKPEAEVEIGKRKLQVSARAAEGAEREELWRACNQQYAGFDDYIKWLDRTPSVWVLEPIGGVSAPGRRAGAAEDADVGTTSEPAAAANDTAPADLI